jgi:hypothetical protein
MKSSDGEPMITNISGIKGETMNNPRINQCMSCAFLKTYSCESYKDPSGSYSCTHENKNDPDLPGFCYDYQDIEEATDVTGE